MTLPALFIYRFSPLLEEETVGICLDKEDPQVTLAVLTLLTHIVKSPTIVGLLCSHQGLNQNLSMCMYSCVLVCVLQCLFSDVDTDPCIPLSCYQCLLEPPPGPPESVYRVRIQVGKHLIIIILLLSHNCYYH